jgi:hypothetical protein
VDDNKNAKPPLSDIKKVINYITEEGKRRIRII